MSRHEKDDRGWGALYHPGPKDEHQRRYEEEPKRFGKGKKRKQRS